MVQRILAKGLHPLKVQFMIALLLGSVKLCTSRTKRLKLQVEAMQALYAIMCLDLDDLHTSESDFCGYAGI